MIAKLFYNDLEYEYHADTNTWICTGKTEDRKQVIPPGVVVNKHYIKILNELKEITNKKMTNLNWTQYQQLINKQAVKIDKLVNKYSHNPNHKDAHKWKQVILDSGLYDENDLEYLVILYNTLNKG